MCKWGTLMCDLIILGQLVSHCKKQQAVMSYGQLKLIVQWSYQSDHGGNMF